jgi:hypothetical protein
MLLRRSARFAPNRRLASSTLRCWLGQYLDLLMHERGVRNSPFERLVRMFLESSEGLSVERIDALIRHALLPMLPRHTAYMTGGRAAPRRSLASWASLFGLSVRCRTERSFDEVTMQSRVHVAQDGSSPKAVRQHSGLRRAAAAAAQTFGKPGLPTNHRRASGCAREISANDCWTETHCPCIGEHCLINKPRLLVAYGNRQTACATACTVASRYSASVT